MSRWNLRKKPRTSYYEPEEPPLDEYIYCDQCADIVYEYCAIHGPLLVVVDDKVPSKTGLPAYVPHAALTIPSKILHLAVSMIPGAGIGVFSTITLPIGVRFGPYRGKKEPVANTDYCWQIYNDKHKASHVIDAQDANKSNWMRYVNCARHWCEQNLLAFQYQGQLYYRTIKIIPRFTELLVFYGTEFANYLNIDMRLFNCVAGISKLTIAMPKKHEIEKKDDQSKPMNKEPPSAPAMDVTEKRVVKTKRKKLFVIPKVITKTSIKEPINNITKDCNKNLLVESSMEFIKTGNLEDVNNVVEDCNNNLPAPRILPSKDGDVQSANVMLLPTDNSKSTHDNTIAKKKIKIDTTKETKKTVDLIDNEKKFSCSLCQFRTKTKPCLKSHINIVHIGKKDYKCSYCASAFTHESNLKTHERIHTGEKPYKCNFCESAFTQLVNLRTHERIHTGEKPFKCNYCASAFTHSSALRKHERIHTGEKPFKCNYCASAFTQESHLRCHERTHTGEKPYKCSYCTSLFTRSHSLKTHQRKHCSAKLNMLKQPC